MKTLLEQKYEKQKELIQFLTTDYLDYSDTEGDKIETKLRSELVSLESKSKALELQSSQTGEECPNCKETVSPCACMRNICIRCGKSVGNITFTVCDDCWGKSQSPSEDKIMSETDKKLEIEIILKLIESEIEKPFVTAQFGDNWREQAKEHYDFDDVINVAWKQGRKALLLEKALRESLKTHPFITKDKITSAEDWFNANSHEFINDGYSLHRVMNRETFLRYASQFSQSQRKVVTDEMIEKQFPVIKDNVIKSIGRKEPLTKDESEWVSNIIKDNQRKQIGAKWALSTFCFLENCPECGYILPEHKHGCSEYYNGRDDDGDDDHFGEM